MLKIHQTEQGTPEWLRLRQGIITASEVSDVVKMDGTARDGKTRLSYMSRLIAEKYTELTEGVGMTQDMERGHRLEGGVVDVLKANRNYEIERVGFITNTFGTHNHTVGYSPDGLVGDKGCIEAKTHKSALQVYQLLDAFFRRNSKDTSLRIPDDHYAQIQFGLWVSEREWCDYIAYNENGVPAFIRRFKRNDNYINNLEKSCGDFYNEMFEAMQYIRDRAWNNESFYLDDN